ncbi:hypothetical protein ABB37_00099 [Leptomonas pyrrhocoris]|uniref:Uncharacterized protein n=1 Tax=Leptomonas pyrrhocoris TaxID=157538 RepID=A0A0N0DZW3_LEPPY|nr:hypothetical protein ABB37_00099 [Leptomonas pyrrhocoris]KPA85735.1 hypothetical protein ABB37_00099 [Leptomonas pyrrhocoris]|eukprot:XP_015664174.1 hypothetical protein ABB37_00099 [Leptomonas pyrrhocoris]
MPSLREYWQSGLRALHIEENISNAFANFAPYAGADEQRIVVTRQSALSAYVPTSSTPTTSIGTPLGPASYVSSSSSVIMEENGDFTVQARDAGAGSLTFSTTGHLQLDAAVRVPLPPPSTRSPAEPIERAEDGKGDANRKQPTESAAPTPEKTDSKFTPPVTKPPPSQLRFSDYTRPVVLPSSHRPRSPAGGTSAHNTDALSGSFGQLEIEASLPDWDSSRQSLGARIGPAAVRLTRSFSAAATATATEAAAAALQNSGSQSDEDELARTLRMEKSRRYQHTVDAALCVPFGGGVERVPTSSSTAGSDRAGRREIGSQTLQGRRIALRTAPWALTCGLQFPMDLGDTLMGISLQNDRATSVLLPYPGVEWAVSASPSSTSSAQPTDKDTEGKTEAGGEEAAVCVACVPSLLYSNDSPPATIGDDRASRGAGTAAVSAPLPSYFAVPYFTFRFLLVQTLGSHTLVRESSPFSSPQRDESGNTSVNTSATTRLASSYDWGRLPTLVGVNVGIDRERLRLSAASIMHDGEVDLEVAGVLDMTPWTPRMPTVVKVGYNNAGRFAAGITSLFYETVSATLGMHVERGEQPKFGIEVKL